jgi:hypothetical protein
MLVSMKIDAEPKWEMDVNTIIHSEKWPCRHYNSKKISTVLRREGKRRDGMTNIFSAS